MTKDEEIQSLKSRIDAFLAAMHEVDRYCNTVRTNYRQGAGEEIVASTVKSHIRPFVKGNY